MAPGSVLTGLMLVSPRSSPDGFVFCTSSAYTEELFHQWQVREGLDACYEIMNVHGFCAAITRKVQSSARFVGGRDVIYRDRQIDYTAHAAKVSPAITKYRDYEWQCESRAIWQALMPSPPLKPWVIKVPDARGCARPHAIMRNGAVVYA